MREWGAPRSRHGSASPNEDSWRKGRDDHVAAADSFPKGLYRDTPRRSRPDTRIARRGRLVACQQGLLRERGFPAIIRRKSGVASRERPPRAGQPPYSCGSGRSSPETCSAICPAADSAAAPRGRGASPRRRDRLDANELGRFPRQARVGRSAPGRACRATGSGPHHPPGEPSSIGPQTSPCSGRMSCGSRLWTSQTTRVRGAGRRAGRGSARTCAAASGGREIPRTPARPSAAG